MLEHKNKNKMVHGGIGPPIECNEDDRSEKWSMEESDLRFLGVNEMFCH